MENMGRKIKELRLRHNLTQEALAESVGVTAQAVSKWETGAGFPDITALPVLSETLGVTLDELFDLTEERHISRIETMLDEGADMSDENYAYARRVLTDGLSKPETRGRCLTMLCDLLIARGDKFYAEAERYAKEALELEPEKKDNHSCYNMAVKGHVWDWCASNHAEYIDFYKAFIEKNPNYAPGYLWLLDKLIVDGRLSEAREYLERMKRVRDSYHVELYAGWIEEKAGNRKKADELWDKMAEKYPDIWFVYSSRGDNFAKRAEWDKAIAEYKRAFDLQTEKPRYTDNLLSIAQISEIKGDKAAAIEAYKATLELLADDWSLTEGYEVRRIKEKMKALS